MRSFELKALERPFWNTKVKSDTVRGSERWLGYFLGPAMVACLYAAVSGSYLNTFYTDVLQLSPVAGGMFLTLMPVFSKILDAITNIVMGRIVDNTKCSQGKGRPWILISGPLMAITAILMFAVPRSNVLITAVWVVCSYNLFFSISYTMYNLSNVVMISLSTRDSKQRDTLSMAASMGINMVPGAVLAVVFPSFILPYIGVDQAKWIKVMTIMALLAIPGVLLQYFFTRERVTEEVRTGGAREEETEEKKEAAVPLKTQIKACFSSKYWVMIIIALIIWKFYENWQTTAMHYYANWVLGTYNDGRTLTILNIIGQAMLGPGVLILWPMVKKFNKQKVYVLGCAIAAIGGFIGFLNARQLVPVLVALTIRSIGSLPLTYVTLSMLADALDHVEYISGYRCDGFSSSIYSIIITVTNGLALGLFNLGLEACGYVPPAADGSWVAQSATVQNYLSGGMFLVPAVSAIVLLVIFSRFDLEKQLPQMKLEKSGKKLQEDGADGKN